MSDQHGQWGVEADVVVLGSGGAALIAALSAHHHGASEVVGPPRRQTGLTGSTFGASTGQFRPNETPRSATVHRHG